jgi:hypothetical protein
VFRLLRARDVASLPNPSHILDYLDLCIVVPLQSWPLRRRVITTASQPQPFIFDSQDNVFRDATRDPTNPDLVHIFMPLIVAERDDDPTAGPVLNLIYPNPRLYWQLPTDSELVLATIVVRGFNTQDVCDEIEVIDEIAIRLRQRAAHIRRALRERRERRERRRGGACRSGRAAGGAAGGVRSARGGADNLGSAPRESQSKKARRKQPLLKFLSAEVEEASDGSREQLFGLDLHPPLMILINSLPAKGLWCPPRNVGRCVNL